MFRNYDWQCTKCGHESEHIIVFPQGELPPALMSEHCGHCEQHTKHKRLISIPSPYMGEKVYNPMVAGGTHDTVGRKSLPELPHIEPDSKGQYETGALREHFASSDWREAKKARRAVADENKMKQKRAAAIKRGENINMRRDRLPGDPHITA